MHISISSFSLLFRTFHAQTVESGSRKTLTEEDRDQGMEFFAYSSIAKNVFLTSLAILRNSVSFPIIFRSFVRFQQCKFTGTKAYCLRI